VKGSHARQVFVVHHNPDGGEYGYGADPTDAVASAHALMSGEQTWVAGNCRRMIHVGDWLLFKMSGAKLKDPVGVYAVAQVTGAPAVNQQGVWVFRYRGDKALTRLLTARPLTGTGLRRLVGRSFGASIQAVGPRGVAHLKRLMPQFGVKPDAAPRLTHGLLILRDPLNKILAGTKTWEIRGKATARRGPIALIESKSGTVVGTCDVVDVVGPLSLRELRQNARRTGFRPTTLPYRTTYAWVVEEAARLRAPVPYQHPAGAVIWVKLKPGVRRRVERSS
jgi:hypothetical protein